MAKILVLERDPVEAWKVRAELTLGSDHDVAVVEDPKEALKRVLHEPFDLVLADWAGVDGGWFCEKLRAHRPIRRIPVILVGPDQDMRDPVDIEHLLRTRYGCHDYLQRPLDLGAMRELVDQYVSIGKLKAKGDEESAED